MKTLTALMFLLFVSNSFSQNWTKIEGTYPFVNLIHFTNDEKLIIGSDSIATDLNSSTPRFAIEGWGYQVSDDQGASFSEPQLSGMSIYSIVEDPQNTNKWLAAVRQLERGRIIKSENAGDTWNTSGFLCEGSFQIMNIKPKIVNGNVRYFAGALNTTNGLRISNDEFENCDPYEQLTIQVTDLSISPVNPNIMFIATSHQSTGQIFRSVDGGETWIADESGIDRLRVNTVLAASHDPRIVYSGADSIGANGEVFGKGIYFSADTGKTWTPVGAFNQNVFDIERHPTKTNVYAAACGEGGVYVSASNGGQWEKFDSGIEEVDVRKVKITPWDNEAEGGIIIAGTFGDGIFVSEPINTVVSVADNLYFSDEIRIYPQPAIDFLQLEINSTNADLATFEITDMLGNQMLAFNKNLTLGNNLIDIPNIGNLATGVYFIRIQSGNKFYNAKFVKN